MIPSNEKYAVLSESYVKLTTPRITFYETPVYNCWVHTIDIAYTQWMKIQQSGHVPKSTTRRVYLTDEELVMFKLAGYLQEPERILCSGHTYITG